MAQTKEGGKKAKRTMIKEYGRDFYSKIGSEGGKTITENTKNRGFGSMSPERHRQIASKGGKASTIKRGYEVTNA